MFSKRNFTILLFLIAAVSIARFLYLEKSPPGFYVDESIGAANIICIRKTGTDGYGVSFPLFAEAAKNAGGYTTPVFLYFGSAWTFIFGDAIWSFRAFTVFITTLTIWGLFLIMRLFGGREAAWLTVLAASLSPWAWQFSRISWDPPLMPLFVVWGMYFYLKSQHLKNALISGVLFSLAMYSYPPGRVLVPLFFLGLSLYTYFLKRWNFKFTIVFLVSIVVASLPLLTFLLSPTSMARFNMVGIANKDYLRQFGEPGVFLFLKIFFKNLFLHFHPKYLFLTGDTNLRHSTQLAGQLGWLDVFGLFSLVIILIKFKTLSGDRKKSFSFLFLCLFGFLCGVIPSALTWESIPHALRSIGAWPFVACIVGIGLAELQKRNQRAIYSIFAISFLFVLSFGTKYFTQYPESSYYWFDVDVKKWAQEAKMTGDWNTFQQRTGDYLELGKKYYEMAYGGKSCRQGE